MTSAHSLQGLMKWLTRDEWRARFAEAFDAHLLPACEQTRLDINEVVSTLGEDSFTRTVWGSAFEDFLTRDFENGSNIVDDYLKHRVFRPDCRSFFCLLAFDEVCSSLEEKMESRMTMIVSAGVLSVALSLPANAGEKISGHNPDFQTLSEVTATIPDKPGHILKQTVVTFKTTSGTLAAGPPKSRRMRLSVEMSRPRLHHPSS
jgi:hypothetical protein